jgi:hypothetical protein
MMLFSQSNKYSIIVPNKIETEPIHFIGIASFGPICLDKKSKIYGSITTTPK